MKNGIEINFNVQEKQWRKGSHMYWGNVKAASVISEFGNFKVRMQFASRMFVQFICLVWRLHQYLEIGGGVIMYPKGKNEWNNNNLGGIN